MKLSIPLVVQSRKASGTGLPCEEMAAGQEKDCPAATEKKHVVRPGPAALPHYKCHASGCKHMKFISQLVSTWQQLSL